MTIDPGTSSVVASPSCLVELLLAIFCAVFTGFFLLSRCRERKRFFMPFQELVVHFKARKEPPSHFEKRGCLFLALGKVTMVLKTF